MKFPGTERSSASPGPSLRTGRYRTPPRAQPSTATARRDPTAHNSQRRPTHPPPFPQASPPVFARPPGRYSQSFTKSDASAAIATPIAMTRVHPINATYSRRLSAPMSRTGWGATHWTAVRAALSGYTSHTTAPGVARTPPALAPTCAVPPVRPARTRAPTLPFAGRPRLQSRLPTEERAALLDHPDLLEDPLCPCPSGVTSTEGFAAQAVSGGGTKTVRTFGLTEPQRLPRLRVFPGFAYPVGKLLAGPCAHGQGNSGSRATGTGREKRRPLPPQSV